MPKPGPTQRDLIREAVDALRAGTGPRPDLADAVQHFTSTAAAAERKTSTLPLYISKATWARAKRKATAEGRTRSDVIEDGYRELLAGRFTPARPARSDWGSGAGDAKGTVSIRLREGLAELVDQVAAYIPADPLEFIWEASPAQVAVAWLEQYAPPPRPR